MNKKEIKKRLDALPKEEDLAWLCVKCGESRYGRKLGCCTFHQGKCDLCGKELMATEPRDFRRGEKI